MATDLKRLKKHFKAYEPTLKELERKYQVRPFVSAARCPHSVDITDQTKPAPNSRQHHKSMKIYPVSRQGLGERLG